MGYWLFTASFIEIAQGVHEICSNNLCPDEWMEGTDGQRDVADGQPKNIMAFVDTVGWQRHKKRIFAGDYGRINTCQMPFLLPNLECQSNDKLQSTDANQLNHPPDLILSCSTSLKGASYLTSVSI